MWLRILGVDLNEASILEARIGEGEGEGVECGVVDGRNGRGEFFSSAVV